MSTAINKEWSKAAWSKTKRYLIASNTKKNLYVKLIVFFVVMAVVLTAVFVIRDQLQPKLYQTVLETGFINIVVTYNTGIGFSGLNDNSAAVYALQSIMLILILSWLIAARHYDIMVCLSMVVAGSFSNIMDRATSSIAGHPHSVLDYFQFWFGGAVFNFADTCIVIGFIALAICYLIRIIKDCKKENKANNHVETQQDKRD